MKLPSENFLEEVLSLVSKGRGEHVEFPQCPEHLTHPIAHNPKTTPQESANGEAGRWSGLYLSNS